MKILFLFLIASFYLSLISCEEKYEIDGRIDVPDGTKVYLVRKGKPIQGKYNDKLDSTIVKSNSFRLSGNMQDPNYYSIALENYRGYLPFFMEAESYRIEMKSDSIWKGSISPRSDDFNLDKTLDSKLRPFIKRINETSKNADKFKKLRDSVNFKLSLKANQKAARDRDLASLEFVKKNPNSYVSLLRFPLGAIRLTKDEKISAFSHISSRFADHPYYKKINYELFELDEIISEGKKIPVFKLKNLGGENLLISKFSEKFILIDIWASWCGPCIKKFPEVKELSAKYPNSLDVVMISIDESNFSWKEAIKKHDLEMFLNYIDYDGEVEDILGVKAIPFKLLLNNKAVIHLINPTLQQVDSILIEFESNQI